jgi:hypothetical protein
MDAFKKNIFPILILTLLVGLLIGFRSFLLDNIVQPVALLFWAVWRVISSVDQYVYWVVLIVCCVIFLIRLIPSEKDNSTNPSYNQTYKPPNRVEYWQNLIDESMLGKNKSEYLRNRIKDLVITTISQVEQPATTEVDEIIATGIPSLSPAARQYLFTPGDKNGTSPMKNKTNNAVFVPKWLRRWQKKHTHQNNIVLDEILKWMEMELEIKDEQ